MLRLSEIALGAGQADLQASDFAEATRYAHDLESGAARLLDRTEDAVTGCFVVGTQG